MPSAFVLFGELRADTQSFRNSLRDADTSLNSTANAITAVEGRAKSIGVTTAASGRQFDKFGETLAQAQSRLVATAAAFERGEATQNQMRAALVAVDRAAAGVNSRLADTNAKLTDVANKSVDVAQRLQLVGDSVKAIGTSMTVALTVPLAALAYQSTQSASSLDTLRTRLQAATGTVESANAAFEHLRNLSQQNAGVLTSAAVATFAFLKPMGLASDTIDEVIKSFGKLKSANPEADLQRMAINLGQLFNQDFERTDLKEMIGAFPRFGQVMANAFKLPASDLAGLQVGLKELKANGLTLEELFAGFAKGVNTDQFLKNIADPIEVRFAKLKERVMVAIEPIGKIILTALEKVLPPITAFIEQLSSAFSKASPAIQIAAVALGAIVAAAGPAIVILGTLITSISALVAGVAAAGGIAAVAATAGTVLLVVGGIIAQMTPIIALLAAQIAILYAAWQTNFGGIRDFTFQAWNVIQTTVGSAMQFLYGAIVTYGNQALGWWQANWPMIQEIVTKVSEGVKATVQAFLNAVNSFWDAHGQRITGAVTALWTLVSGVVSGAMTAVVNTIKLGLQIINGDWAGAWQTVLVILQNAVTTAVQYTKNLTSLIIANLTAVLPMIVQWGAMVATSLASAIGRGLVGVVKIFANLPAALIKLIPTLYSAGVEIGAAVMRGIQEALSGKIGAGAGGSLEGPNIESLFADLMKGVAGSGASIGGQFQGGGGIADVLKNLAAPTLAPTLATSPATSAGTVAGQTVAASESVLNAISRELEAFRRDFNGKRGGREGSGVEVTVKDQTRSGVEVNRLTSANQDSVRTLYDPDLTFGYGGGLLNT